MTSQGSASSLHFEHYLDAKGSLTHLPSAWWERFSVLLNEFFHQRSGSGAEFVPSRRPTFLIGNGWTMAATSEHSDKSESWEEVVNELVEELYDKSVLENCNPVQKAELIAQAGLLHTLKRNLAAKVRPPPTVAHHFLSYLLHCHGGGHVVTTNYDCVLDTAMHDQLVPPRPTEHTDSSLSASNAATAPRPVPIFISVLDAIPVGPSFTMDQAHLHPPLQFESGHIMLHKMHGSFHDFKDEEKVAAEPANTATAAATASNTSAAADTATATRTAAAASAASSDYYTRTGLSDHVLISESEYRAALQRLISSTPSSSVLFACSTSLLIVLGKGMYWEDLTPNFAIMGTKAARVDAWNRFMENRSVPDAAEDRQWALSFLPKGFSGIYVCAEPPHKSQVATLLNMGLLTLILGRTKNQSPLFHSVFNLLALRFLFPMQYSGFCEQVRGGRNGALKERLAAYESQAGYFSPQPLFVAVGVTGDGLFIDEGDRDFLTSTCKPNQVQIKFPVGAAFTVASTAAALLSAHSDDKIQRCALVSAFPRAVPEPMMQSVRNTWVHIGLGLFNWADNGKKKKGGDAPHPPHSQSHSKPWPLPFGSKDTARHMDVNQPWRRTKLYLGRPTLWTDTYSLSDLGRRSCLEQAVEYTFTVDELDKWRINIRAKLATGLLDKTLLIYCDRFLLAPLNLPIEGDSHPLLELFTGTASRPGRGGVEPDGLLETGCAEKTDEFALVKRHINIVSMGWTYFQRHRQATVPRPTQHTPSTEGAFLRHEKDEIENFFDTMRPLQDKQQQRALPLPNEVTELMQVARDVSVGKNSRHWCVLTLRHRGALCVDLVAAELGERSSWALVHLPHATTVPSYVAQAGDVFRGAFGAAFCATLRDKPHINSFELLLHCTREAVWVANKRTAMFSPEAFLGTLREPRRLRRVLVVGGGVIGLTTAIRLMVDKDLKQRYDVTVLAPASVQPASDSHREESKGDKEVRTEADAALTGRSLKTMPVSSAAASFWMPFGMGGPLTPQQAEWAKATYDKWKELYDADEGKTRTSALTKGPCLRLRCTKALLVKEWLPLLVDHLKAEAGLDEVPVEGHTAVACKFDTYLIESRQYMEELERRFLELGGVRGQLQQPLTSISSLAQQHPDCYVVNCTGESGCAVSGDPVEMHGVRGDLLHFYSADLKEAAEALTSVPQVVIDEVSDDQLAYVVRHQDTVVLGGTAWKRGEEPSASHNAAHLIRDNCLALLTKSWKEAIRSHLLPVSGTSEYFAHTVGYRPTRKGGPRVGREEGTNIFHNYGHAGSGWSMCWGAADEIARCMQPQQQHSSSSDEKASDVEEPLRSSL